MNFYEYLNVDQNASDEQIRKAFRNLAKTTHPDYNKQDSAFWDMVELNIIRDTLLNPTRRAAYNLQISQPDHNRTQSTSEYSKKPNIYHSVKSFFTYRCQICGIELKSTWRGYCLHHYLEVTNQLHNPDFIFEYAGQKYQWADPPEDLLKTNENSNKQHHVHNKLELRDIVIFTTFIISLLILIIIYLINLLS
jgi:curved DNA-binding protein CbpA